MNFAFLQENLGSQREFHPQRDAIHKKSGGILHKPSVACEICGYDSLLVCIYKLTAFIHAPSCMYYTVCVVVVHGSV